jgi:coenzyme PQQ precursor peptide PqqA
MHNQLYNDEETFMKWETPSYNEVRFGFEVTMYINNR